MAQDIKIAGASYPDVPAVDFETPDGDSVRFVDEAEVAEGVSNALDAIDAKGGTVTGAETVADLADAIETIPEPHTEIYEVEAPAYEYGNIYLMSPLSRKPDELIILPVVGQTTLGVPSSSADMPMEDGYQGVFISAFAQKNGGGALSYLSYATVDRGAYSVLPGNLSVLYYDENTNRIVLRDSYYNFQGRYLVIGRFNT